jgi:hypothetical protein
MYVRRCWGVATLRHICPYHFEDIYFGIPVRLSLRVIPLYFVMLTIDDKIHYLQHQIYLYLRLSFNNNIYIYIYIYISYIHNFMEQNFSWGAIKSGLSTLTDPGSPFLIPAISRARWILYKFLQSVALSSTLTLSLNLQTFADKILYF